MKSVLVTVILAISLMTTFACHTSEKSASFKGPPASDSIDLVGMTLTLKYRMLKAIL